LQQVLAQLEYLPVEWQPTGTPVPNTLSAQIQAAYAPPAGTFSWRYQNVPPTLAALWQPGLDTVMTTGAVMAFERQNGLPVDGQVGPAVWKALIEAALADHVNPHGYSYVYVSETLPERLTIWHNGQIVLTSLANTGIPQSPTYLGTFPVYLRYVSQTMSGVNPNGTPYVDPGVPWVNYFAGGDAVHGFVRAQYGFPQSLGCVELPIPEAAIAWNYIHYGTLVTVEPPGSPSLP
jgi:peptidoglycan hydrolase-like protein with peptidoglycan-binding domain